MSPEEEAKIERAIRYIIRIDVAFEEYMPIIMTTLVLGILTHSTYVLTMVCFFGYLFSTLLFNYADLISKLRRGVNNSSAFSKINYLISGLFIIGLFLSYWVNQEWNLTVS